jgi:hypothetical protein
MNAVAQTAGGYVKLGLDTAGVGAQKAKEAADFAAPYVRSAADAVAPYAKSAVETVRDAAGPALRNAQPTLQVNARNLSHRVFGLSVPSELYCRLDSTDSWDTAPYCAILHRIAPYGTVLWHQTSMSHVCD